MDENGLLFCYHADKCEVEKNYEKIRFINAALVFIWGL